MNKSLLIFFLIALIIAAAAQNRPSSTPLREVSLDRMNSGYFFAGSKIEDKDALGGFGTSDNFPKSVVPSLNVSQNTISLIALADEVALFDEKFDGVKLMLVNATNKQIAFAASDSRLNIIQEALDSDGKWKPIEYLPSSWCGNSYHNVFLGSNEYWEFAAPRYTGNFKTKLRFRLDEKDSDAKTTTLFSNDFDGSINKGQFIYPDENASPEIIFPKTLDTGSIGRP